MCNYKPCKKERLGFKKTLCSLKWHARCLYLAYKSHNQSNIVPPNVCFAKFITLHHGYAGLLQRLACFAIQKSIAHNDIYFCGHSIGEGAPNADFG